MAGVIDFVTSPRGRVLTIGVWILLAIAGFLGRQHLDEVTAAGQSAFLPGDADSTKVAGDIRLTSGGGDEIPAIIVLYREGGLTGKDKKAIAAIPDELEKYGLKGATPAIAPVALQSIIGKAETKATGLPAEAGISKDGTAALVALAINSDIRDAISDDVALIRSRLGADLPEGLDVYVTGAAGIAAELEEVADSAETTLLLATLGLILLLLLFVYRAPVLAVIPLVVVGLAYMITAGIVYLLIKADVIVVNLEGTLLLLVLIFGAGTDYSLLVIQRYRDELAKGLEPVEALRLAARASFRPISASAGTVAAALLVLLIADLEVTRWLGPILAIGIGVMLVATFSLLLAILSLLGERAFWPGGHGGSARGSGLWSRLAEIVTSRYRPVTFAVLALLVVAALGNFKSHDTLGFGEGEARASDTTTGTKLLDEKFPPGISYPVPVVVSASDQDAALKTVKDDKGVTAAFPAPPSGEGENTLVIAILDSDPFAAKSETTVKRLRRELGKSAPGSLVGGITAENVDVEDANSRDTKLIVPITLAVILVILMLLLRAVVAPVYLLATVILSFAATLGITTFLFAGILGEEGLAFNLVLTAFIFLIALGVDYNIFLMSRAREDAETIGTRAGMVEAMQSTGSVITGAGLILAGTFATLILLPLDALVQIGAAVAIGVLLDTFVVRALLVPSITVWLGPRAWLPGRASGDTRE